MESFPELGAGVAVYMNGSLLEKVVDEFTSLPDEERTIRVHSTAYEGDIKRSYDEIDILGTGGYSARFRSNDSLRGEARVSTLSSEWIENEGLVLTGQIDVQARADIRLHIDPYVGGGFNTNVGLGASARVPMRVGLVARLVENSDESAVMFGPAVQCARFPLTLEETELDLFGIETDAYIGATQMTPWMVMGPETLWYEFIEERSVGGLTFDSEYWIGVRLVPTSVVSSTSGYHLLADFESKLSVGRPELAETNSGSDDTFAQVWSQEVQSDCPEKRDMVFLFAGEDFGPNNDLVKTITLVVEAVGITEEVAEISWEHIVRVVEDPREIPVVVAEIIDDLGRELDRIINDLFDIFGL